MAAGPLLSPQGSVAIIRRMSMETYMVRLYTGPLSQELEYVSVEAEKITTAEEVVRVAAQKLRFPNPQDYELAEVLTTAGQLCKERRLEASETPVRIKLMWPRTMNQENEVSGDLHTGYRFYIREKNLGNVNRTVSWMECRDPNPVDNFLTAFLKQPTSNKEYSDLCNLPDLNELTLLENLECRFNNLNIYTYVGSILIAVNPFKFFPIYNPKYVKMYQNKRLGDLPPHIFAIADAAFHTMLRTKKNQCIVISGESGSGKTESTNLLLHHLTALSHKGLHGSGVEQTILGAGPVLEAFGNAKTVHNNNSSRFGKFIQVNYKENGMVHGAIVEKYLLEKSRIVSQAKNERNYHVFYYLLAGADNLEREKLHLGKPEDYYYLRQSGCYTLEEVDEANEFSRLKQSMEMVGFSQVTQKRIFGVMSAVLHLGNVKFKKKGDQHYDESVSIVNPETISIISNLLKVKEKILREALTQKRATAGDETVVMNHRMEDAVGTRDAMAKCLYGALFDWIVLKVNQALLAKRHNSEHQLSRKPCFLLMLQNLRSFQGNSIGVLDIFGFEDFSKNSFEQFCINYANEHLQYYFNQHIFKFEQEEYKKEGIQWKNIEFIDNTGCLELFSRRQNGLFSLLDEECNFPGATNETLLSKFHHHHSRGNVYYEAPQQRELAFTVVHYAGRVKYQIKDFREKNSDQIRTDILGNLKSSSLAFVRELMGVDPVAVLRWTILKTLIKSVFAFIKAGKQYKQRGGPEVAVTHKRKPSADYLPIPGLNSSHFLSPQHSPSGTSGKGHISLSPMHDTRYTRRIVSGLGKLDTDDEDDVFMYSPCTSPHGRSPVYKSEDEYRVMRLASKVLQKNKSFRVKARPQTMFSDVKTLKAIASRTMYSGGKLNTKQKPPSVSAQFQWSLSRLMQTLNEANPFFIRCIKSNAEKEPCSFSRILVLQQLRYTGMLATVRIRQSGYNYRLLFEEFAQLYKILLPKGRDSGKEDICTFLQTMDMNRDNYQIGLNKVFLRETEKLYLDECLHRAIMKRVVSIQRWVKTRVERKNFLLLRTNTVILQKYIRSFLARRRVVMIFEATLLLQRWFRGVRERQKYHLVRRSAIRIQAHVKGHLCRKKYRQLKTEHEHRLQEERDALKLSEDMHSSTSDEGVLMKDGSADELEIQKDRRDSEGSSGILDDSESDTLSDAKSRGDSVGSPPCTPTPGHSITVESLPGSKDTFLNRTNQQTRVTDIAKKFQSSKYDDDSPTTEAVPQRMLPLSPERVEHQRHLEEKLTRPRRGSTSHTGSQDDTNISPIKMIRKLVAHKKPRTSDGSSDDLSQEHRDPRDHIGAVQVLPHKSPTHDDTKSITSTDDQEEKAGFDRRKQKTVKDKGWNVAKTSQWQYPDEYVIQEVYILQLLDEFFNKKIQGLIRDSGERKRSQFDEVFLECLQSFKTEFKATLSAEMQKSKEGQCNIKYRSLFANFEVTMNDTCEKMKMDSNFPVTLCLNAFRGYLDDFRNTVNVKKNKHVKKVPNRNKKRDKGKKDLIEHHGHKYSQVQFGIPTFCELCSNVIWIMEKGCVCQICRYTCHRKCIYRSTTPCKSKHEIATGLEISGTKVFGVPLPALVSADMKIPEFMDNLITLIETHGLFTEGIYRRPGAAPKIKMLKMALDSGIKDVNIEDYPIHVLTSTLKSFFRELPEPVLTFELYDEFIQAAEIQDEKEAVQALFNLVDRIPKVNHDVLERLIFHLARVASKESSNKMSVNGLAIIFGPCLLRSNKETQAQEMLLQVSRQTQCVEKILEEQLKKLLTTLQDISTLESAQATAAERLTVVRASMRENKKSLPAETEKKKAPPQTVPEELAEQERELAEQERVINSHIKSLQIEKDNLTSTMPQLEYRHSSDDEMLSVDDMESVYDTADDEFGAEDQLSPVTVNFQGKHSADSDQDSIPPPTTSPPRSQPNNPSDTRGHDPATPYKIHFSCHDSAVLSNHKNNNTMVEKKRRNSVACVDSRPSDFHKVNTERFKFKWTPSSHAEKKPGDETLSLLTKPILLHTPTQQTGSDSKDTRRQKGHTPGSSPGLRQKHPHDNSPHASSSHLTRGKVYTKSDQKAKERLTRQNSDPSSAISLLRGSPISNVKPDLDYSPGSQGTSPRSQPLLTPGISAEIKVKKANIDSTKMSLVPGDWESDEEIMV